MAEIYRNSVNVGVTFSIPSNVATVTSAKIYKDGVEYTGVTAIDTEANRTIVNLPFEVTKYDGDFTVVYTFNINGGAQTATEAHKVVTPLFTPIELKNFDSDFNALSNDSIEFLESKIRSLFYTWTGQKFGLSNETVSFMGGDRTSIRLPKRCANPAGPTFGDSTYHARVTNDGWIVESFVSDSWIDKFESAFDFHPRTFRDGTRYYLKGEWGYYSVPEDIVKAAMILAQDYGCDQSLWRDRWMKSVRLADMRFEFDSRAFTLSGNVVVDQILDRYMLERMQVL